MREVTKSKTRELWVGDAIRTGINLDADVSKRDSVLDIMAFRIDTQAWLDSLTEKQHQRALDLADGTGTTELAERWKVSPYAVSNFRRQLNES